MSQEQSKNKLHLVKLCVGVDTLEQLIDWRKTRYAPGEPNQHVTRMWPKRADDLLDGGSLYWVIRGTIAARQRILSLDEAIGKDGIRRCAIILDPELIRTAPAPRRPFQGWRYLKGEDAPRDLPKARAHDDDLPPELSAALADIGLK